MNNDVLAQQVNDASTPVYMTSKSDIVEHYRDNYAENKWRGEIAKTIHDLGLAKDKNGKDLSVASIRRRFEGDRWQKEAKQGKTKDEFVQLGKNLPPVSRKPPAGGFRINWKGAFQISGSRSKGKGKNGKRDGWVKNAHFSTQITGAEALTLANDPNWNTVFLSYFGPAGFNQNPVTDFNTSYLSVDPA